MKTDNEDRLIDAFVDGELELGNRLEVEDRMRSDAAFARRVTELVVLRDAIREGADYHAAPAALRERLRTSSGPQQARDPRPPAAVVAAVRRWLDWRPMVAAAGLVAILAAALSLVAPPAPQDHRLLDDVVASHVRSTLGEHLVDVASSDHHTVKPWLSSKLDFSPPVVELTIPGSVFVGGRVDYLAGRPVAALVYRQGAHVVNTFVWPSAAESGKPVFGAERGYQIAHWSARGMTHWAISDVNREEFAVVVAALEAAEGGSPKP